MNNGKFASALSILAIVFGLATLNEGGSVLFFDGVARAQAGHFVPFVVVFNFVAGFFYVVAGILMLKRSAWALRLALALALSTAMVFGAFAVHVWVGGAHEVRTWFAMTLRLTVWSGISFYLRRAA